MNLIMKLFGIPLGWIMHYLYNFIGNYGVALLVFTLLTRLLLFPITLGQQKSTAKNATIQPKIRAVQEKYGHDRALLQEKTNEVYQEEGFNPMSGCLPMLVQFPILFGLIDVIYRPLTHILRIGGKKVAQASTLYAMLGLHSSNPNMLELDVISAVRSNPLFFGVLGANTLGSIHSINYNFLGMNLMTRPELSMLTGMFKGQFNPVVFIPIISGATALLMSVLTMRQQADMMGGQQEGAGMMKGMMLSMPLMSLWIAFTVPAGVGLYWIYSNIAAIFQNMIMNKFFNPKDYQEQMKKEQEEKKILNKEKAKEERRVLQAELLGKDNVDKVISQKEMDRLKLAAARKRDADKYGLQEEGDTIEAEDADLFKE